VAQLQRVRPQPQARGGRLEQGQQRPPQRREQHGRPEGWEESAMLIVLQAQSALLIGAHRAVYPGARAA
jgi:hypothetical protein